MILRYNENTMAGSIGDYIVSTPGTCSGRPRIAGRRIRVQHIYEWHELQGMSAEEIASEYGLTLAQVYAALAYYYDHREEMEAQKREEQAFVQELMKKAEQVPARSDG